MAKILVADDNSNIQKMVGLALKDQGIDVVAVGNGEAAVRKISDIKPDLVLADVFMPVRNGYEVCRYVKEDAALAHIPVILLVGAFDPLDEQEAQRVGADGVLKKPFVPPDPLISMVKSALARAGVAIGGAPAAEKPAEAARSTADILRGNVGSKIAALTPEKLPEVAPEPVEEFATPREHVKIAAGEEPVAFGNLLNTSEEEEAAVLSSKPMIEIARTKDWDEESQDVPEEEDQEEEAPRGGWRPGGLDEELERAAKSGQGASDWRDEAFHGNSPAKRNGSEHWSQAPEHASLVEVAEVKTATLAAVETKPAEAAAPFSSDAWAAAMAAGVQEKLAKQAEPVIAPEPVSLPETAAENVANELPGTVAASLNSFPAETPAVSEPPAVGSEPANWAPVPESTWEAEAKRASMLASTWDAPVAAEPAISEPAPDETQEISAYSAEEPEIHASTRVEETSAYSSHYEAAGEPEAVAPEEPVAIDTSAEVAIESAPSNPWANAWEAPKAESAPEAAPVVKQEAAPTATEVPQAAAPEAQAQAQPDMDELVARVLGKLNPDVLQKVTHEILKPVIEAIVRDELNSKKP